MPDGLILDGATPGTPCFFDPAQFDPSNQHHIDPSAIPDSAWMLPSNVPGNDERSEAWIRSAPVHLPPPPEITVNSCTRPPPGFVCGPLPAPPGQLVKCVPRMDASDVRQLAARVLPLSVSRGALDDAAAPDSRFLVFPNKYPAAFSRCCGGNFSTPSDVPPLSCTTPVDITGKLFRGSHLLSGQDLGFRQDPSKLSNVLSSRSKIDSIGLSSGSSTHGKMAVIDHDSRGLSTRLSFL
jgi:hypothetical protein